MKNSTIIQKILRRRKSIKEIKEEKLIDSASIGDMAFLLLIFFIVTSSFILRQGIFLSLPSPTSSSIKMDQSKLVEVFPENEGFTFNNETINRETLVAVLNEQKTKEKDSVLIIRMKDNVKYERLVDALSVAKETRIGRVSLKKQGGAN